MFQGTRREGDLAHENKETGDRKYWFPQFKQGPFRGEKFWWWGQVDCFHLAKERRKRQGLALNQALQAEVKRGS